MGAPVFVTVQYFPKAPPPKMERCQDIKFYSMIMAGRQAEKFVASCGFVVSLLFPILLYEYVLEVKYNSVRTYSLLENSDLVTCVMQFAIEERL